MSLSALCPVCEAAVICDDDVMESEVLTCRDCLSAIVIETGSASGLVLAPAPPVEEDWGE